MNVTLEQASDVDVRLNIDVNTGDNANDGTEREVIKTYERILEILEASPEAPFEAGQENITKAEMYERLLDALKNDPATGPPEYDADVDDFITPYAKQVDFIAGVLASIKALSDNRPEAPVTDQDAIVGNLNVALEQASDVDFELRNDELRSIYEPESDLLIDDVFHNVINDMHAKHDLPKTENDEIIDAISLKVDKKLGIACENSNELTYNGIGTKGDKRLHDREPIGVYTAEMEGQLMDMPRSLADVNDETTPAVPDSTIITGASDANTTDLEIKYEDSMGLQERVSEVITNSLNLQGMSDGDVDANEGTAAREKANDAPVSGPVGEEVGRWTRDSSLSLDDGGVEDGSPHDVDWWYRYIQEHDPDLLVPHDNAEVTNAGLVIPGDDAVDNITPSIEASLHVTEPREYEQFSQDLGCMWGMACWRSDIKDDEPYKKAVFPELKDLNFPDLRDGLKKYPEYQGNVPTRYQGYEGCFQQTSPGHFGAIAKEGVTYNFDENSGKFKCDIDDFTCNTKATMENHIITSCFVNINEIAMKAQKNIGILNLQDNSDILLEIANGLDPNQEKDFLYSSSILTLGLPTADYPVDSKSFLETGVLPPEMPIDAVKDYQKRSFKFIAGANGVRHAKNVIQPCIDQLKGVLANPELSFNPKSSLNDKPKALRLWNGMPDGMQQALRKDPGLAANLKLEPRQLLGTTGNGVHVFGDLQLALYDDKDNMLSIWQIEVKGGEEFSALLFSRSTTIQALNGRLENGKIGMFSLVTGKDMQHMPDGTSYDFVEKGGQTGRISLGSRQVYVRENWIDDEKGSRIVILMSKTIDGLSDTVFLKKAGALSSDYTNGTECEQFFTRGNCQITDNRANGGVDPMRDPSFARGVLIIPESRTLGLDVTCETMRAEDLAILQQIDNGLGLPIKVTEDGFPSVTYKAYKEAEQTIGSLFTADSIVATRSLMQTAENDFGWLGVQNLRRLDTYNYSGLYQENGQAVQNIFLQIQDSIYASLALLGPNPNQVVEYHSNVFDEIGGFSYAPEQSWWSKPGHEDNNAYALGFVRAGINGKFIEFEVKVHAIPSVDGFKNEYHEIEAFSHSFKSVDELLNNAHSFLSDCVTHGFQLDKFTNDLDKPGVINFENHYVGINQGKNLYETVGSFKIFDNMKLDITHGIGARKVDANGEHLSYNSFHEYINQNKLEDPRVFAFYNSLQKEFSIVPPGADIGFPGCGTIKGATVENLPDMENCFEVHYPVIAGGEIDTGLNINKTDLPIICDLSNGEVNVYCLKIDPTTGKKGKGALIANGSDITTALSPINNFSKKIDTYFPDHEVGFKVNGFMINPDDGTAKINFKFFRYANDKPDLRTRSNLVSYKATANFTSNPRLGINPGFTKLAIVNDVSKISIDISPDNLDRAHKIYECISQWGILVNQFELTSNGIVASLGKYKKSSWHINVSMPADSSIDNVIQISRKQGKDEMLDVGTLDNAFQYLSYSAYNPVKGTGKPWAIEIGDEPMFYRDEEGNLRFKADLSNINLGNIYAKQDPHTQAWIITDTTGNPFELDVEGKHVEWPSLMTYMEIGQHQGIWRVESSNIGETPGIDSLKLSITNSYGSDQRVDVYYNHSFGLYKCGNKAGNIFTYGTLYRQLLGYGRQKSR